MTDVNNGTACHIPIFKNLNEIILDVNSSLHHWECLCREYHTWACLCPMRVPLWVSQLQAEVFFGRAWLATTELEMHTQQISEWARYKLGWGLPREDKANITVVSKCTYIALDHHFCNSTVPSYWLVLNWPLSLKICLKWEYLAVCWMFSVRWILVVH